MNNKQLFSAIGNIDDKYINEYKEQSVQKTVYKQRQNKHTLLIVAIITIFVALCGATAAIIMEFMVVPDPHHPWNNPVNDQYQFLSSIGKKVNNSLSFNPRAYNLPYNGVYRINAMNNVIEHVSTINGDMILVANSDGKGWQLNANQELKLVIDIDLSAEYSDKLEGERMIIGYFHNRRFTEIFSSGKVMPGTEFTFTATEAGEYFWFIVNASAGVQNLASITVSVG